jgi:ABC-2 type transporter
LSEKVVKLIKKLVQQRQIPSFLSLHQPRSSIWRMLDFVILMAPGGRTCYSGSTHDALPYFSRLGYNCPEETNPAEFLLDLVSIDSEDPYVAATDDERITQLAAAFIIHQKQQQQHQQRTPAQSDSSESKKKPSMVSLLTEKSSKMDMTASKSTTTTTASSSSSSSLTTRGTSNSSGTRPRRSRKKFRLLQRFGYLLHRAWRQNVRNHRINALRLVASIGNALLFSKIFGSIQKGFVSAKSVADRTALLSFGVINMSMMALMKTIDLFAREKPVVMREQQRRQYTSLEYLLSKALAELPLDTLFSAVFTTVLKLSTGIRIGWKELTGAFSLMTIAGASLGFAVGALSPTAELAMSAGVPLMVIFMSVGVINPSGVRANETPSVVVDSLKRLSPIASAIQAVVLGEFRGMVFQRPKQRGGWVQDLPKMGALALVQNGEQVLEELGLGQATYRGAMKHLAVLSAMNLFISWVGLQLHSSSRSSATNMTPAYWLQFQSDNHHDETDDDEG